jgi:hypothetical protein
MIWWPPGIACCFPQMLRNWRMFPTRFHLARTRHSHSIPTIRNRSFIVHGYIHILPMQWVPITMLWVRILNRVRCTTLCDKVYQWLSAVRWFSPGPPVSATYKTDRHDVSEILLKVALNTIKQANKQTYTTIISIKIAIYFVLNFAFILERNDKHRITTILYLCICKSR